MTTRLRDVAREAGLSVAAVSRHLNGSIDLPAATRKRIDEAVRRLQYRPNVIARRLTTGSSETLGFVTTDIGYPFFGAIASAAEAEASARGYSLAIFNSRNDPECEMRFLSKLTDGSLDGLLFLTNHAETAELAARIDVLGRVVLLDEDVAGARAPRLFADNVAGGRLAGRHLIEHGHRSIAFVAGPDGMVSVVERLAGLVSAMTEAGIEIDPSMILCGTYSGEFGQEAFTRLLARPDPPTAIFATADNLAIGILRAARAAGTRIPQDLSLVSFDDMDLVDLFDPPLTTIRQSPEAFGRIGVQLLLDLIGGALPDPQPRRVPVELIARGSVARRQVA